MQLQLEKERIFTQGALTMPVQKILLVCDRGALDNKAYMTQSDFDKVLDVVGHNEVELRDSYDAIFHLVTCAKGAAEFYTLENNGARTETVEQASALDDKIIASWTGHPHLKIIDNATDFEFKMKRLLDEMTSFLGEEAPRDIKRRFLIDYPDIAYLEGLPNCQRVEISQTYLVAPEGEENRVRQRGVDGNYIYFQTKKRNAADSQRIRLERRLSKDEYIRLLMDADPTCRSIRKTRYCLTYKNHFRSSILYQTNQGHRTDYSPHNSPLPRTQVQNTDHCLPASVRRQSEPHSALLRYLVRCLRHIPVFLLFPRW